MSIVKDKYYEKYLKYKKKYMKLKEQQGGIFNRMVGNISHLSDTQNDFKLIRDTLINAVWGKNIRGGHGNYKIMFVSDINDTKRFDDILNKAHTSRGFGSSMNFVKCSPTQLPRTISDIDSSLGGTTDNIIYNAGICYYIFESEMLNVGIGNTFSKRLEHIPLRKIYNSNNYYDSHIRDIGDELPPPLTLENRIGSRNHGWTLSFTANDLKYILILLDNSLKPSDDIYIDHDNVSTSLTLGALSASKNTETKSSNLFSSKSANLIKYLFPKRSITQVKRGLQSLLYTMWKTSMITDIIIYDESIGRTCNTIIKRLALPRISVDKNNTLSYPEGELLYTGLFQDFAEKCKILNNVGYTNPPE